MLQVVRSNHQEITEGVECVKELKHQRDLVNRKKKNGLSLQKEAGEQCSYDKKP